MMVGITKKLKISLFKFTIIALFLKISEIIYLAFNLLIYSEIFFKSKH